MCLGVPGRVVDVQRHGDLEIVEGRVDFDGVVKQTNLSFTPDVQPGDYVVVHVGFSISKIDEASARQTLEYLREIGRIQEELGEPPVERSS
jgi:hydrogenase expression/formation protein HypC